MLGKGARGTPDCLEGPAGIRKGAAVPLTAQLDPQYPYNLNISVLGVRLGGRVWWPDTLNPIHLHDNI